MTRPIRLAVTRPFVILISIALVVSACGPVAPSNGLVQVVNLGTTDAFFHWQSHGILGTFVLGESGTEPISGCSQYIRAFGIGEHQVTITSGSSTRAFPLVGPPGGQAVLWVLVGRDGTVEETSEAEAPARPYCGA